MMARLFAIVAVLSLAAPVSARAQVAWDSPFHMGPQTPGGLAFLIVDPAPGDGVGAMMTWRRSAIPGGLGLRFGVAEGIDDDVAGFGGVDFSGLLLAETQDFPMELIWGTGIGAGIGDYTLITIPFGLFLGTALEGEGVVFTPYAGPRFSLDAHLGRDLPGPGGDDDDLDLAISLDIGGDIAFSEALAIRFGASVGDHEAISIGLVFPRLR